MSTDPILRLLTALLRGRLEQDTAFARNAPRLLGIAFVGAAIFGAVVGTYRGGVQPLAAALKMPLLFLVPTLVVLPAMRALGSTANERVAWRPLAIAALVGIARSAILAAGTAPVLWLLFSVHPGYHLSVLVMAGTLALVGLPGLLTTSRAIPGRRRGLATLCAVGLVGLVSAQTGWLLRPFVVRPTAEIALLRTVEADVFSSLGQSALSTVGIYDGWDARRAGLVGRIAEPEDRR